jgi:diacylglycerol kinase (ATP)
VSEATLLILNPASGRGAAGRVAERLVARARDLFAPLETAVTEAPGDAARLARAAVGRGVARILVAGGDGTLGEVVTGLLSARADAPGSAAGCASAAGPEPAMAKATAMALPCLGLLPIGSGCDLARTLGIPRRIDAALGVAAAGHVLALDAARIAACDGRGRRQVRYFANEASTGLSAKTVERVGGFSMRIGARLGFLAGALAAVAAHRPFEAALELDGERIFEGAMSLCVIGNGCYFGAGMRVAPRAVVDDGLLEIVLVRALPRRSILAHLPAFYLGRHGAHPQVSFHAARRVALLSKGAAESVEIDGESGFALPIEVECWPAALRVYTPAATVVAGAPARATASFVPRVAPAPVASRALAEVAWPDPGPAACPVRDRPRA